ncbi:MAG: hypothetical protein H6Q15_2220 [Bacteroidetes bacterium]|nr:hypothetical protein [Bacteroidota bacterium]
MIVYYTAMKGLVYLFFVLIAFSSKAQEKSQGYVTYAIKYEGDTIPMSFLPAVDIIGYVYYIKASELEQYHKLVRNVKITYPYAKQAGILLGKYQDSMRNMNSSQRKLMMKKAEKDIDKQFGASLKKLTRSQGLILLRLIDRETGTDSYTLVKELRGSLSAFFYQAIGSLFGYNLRMKFDPKNNFEDLLIEKIIYAIETNKI